MNPWIPALITLAGVTLAVGVNLVGFAHYTGRTRGAADAMATVVRDLVAKVEKIENERVTRAEEKGDLGARLSAVEQKVSGIDAMRQDLIRIDSRFAAFERLAETRAESTRLGLDSINRQMAALMQGAAGEVLELPSRRRRAAPPESS